MADNYARAAQVFYVLLRHSHLGSLYWRYSHHHQSMPVFSNKTEEIEIETNILNTLSFALLNLSTEPHNLELQEGV